MKRKEVISLLLIGVMISGIAAAAATEAGSAADPLIALNWLKKTFIPDAVTQAGERVDQQTSDSFSDAAAGTELRVKRSDVLWLESGTTLTPLAGTMNVTAAKGAVVDVTAGEEVPAAGADAVLEHRYLVAEEAKGVFSVTSDTAVVRVVGTYQLSLSDKTDYNAIADALNTMGLFQGSDVPYASGYELESTPTRIEGLVMFLRLMGEEKAALAYPGSGITFADVPDWAEPYVAYAYDKGYTKGQEIDKQWRVVFGTQDPLAPRDYMTFLLRALGYAEETDFQWLSAVADAQTLGVLTAGDVALLTDQPFHRAQVAYLSYFALSAKTAGGETLLDRLTAAGAAEKDVAANAMKGLDGQRL